MLTLLLLSLALFPQSSPTLRDWNRPIEPFRVEGPLYYVGTVNLTSLLITTPAGHVLIDGGLEETAPIIIENIRKLGFRIEDVRILLCTHAHLDHAGGLARLKAASGARVYAGAADVELLARGGRGDFAFGDGSPFPAVKADVGVHDGDEVALGDVRFRAVATPGHTRGCTTWTFSLKTDGRERRVVMVGGTSAPGYRLIDNPNYPGIVADYEATFRKLRSLDSDVAFQGHENLDAERLARRPFVGPAVLREVVDRAEAAFRKQLMEQAAR